MAQARGPGAWWRSRNGVLPRVSGLVSPCFYLFVCSARRSPDVFVMEPTQAGHLHHPALARRLHPPWLGRVLGQGKVSPRSVVVVHVLRSVPKRIPSHRTMTGEIADQSAECKLIGG